MTKIPDSLPRCGFCGEPLPDDLYPAPKPDISNAMDRSRAVPAGDIKARRLVNMKTAYGWLCPACEEVLAVWPDQRQGEPPEYWRERVRDWRAVRETNLKLRRLENKWKPEQSSVKTVGRPGRGTYADIADEYAKACREWRLGDDTDLGQTWADILAPLRALWPGISEDTVRRALKANPHITIRHTDPLPPTE